MSKSIQTQNADTNLTKKFLDYANCADASYAMLHWVNYAKKDNKDENEQGDKQTLGHQFNNQNSTYSRAIEARFQKDKIIDKEGSFCIPSTNLCLTSKDIKIDNDITQVKPDSKLSQRTIDFVNRFKLLAHQENKERSREKGKETDGNYGFSATLFEDTQANSNDTKYILAFRGTEDKNDFLTDHILAEGGIPMQCYFAVKFYEERIKDIIGDSKLIVVGHSLGGYLAQSFCFMYPSKIAEIYTFNSPGLYPDEALKTIIQSADNMMDSNVTKAYVVLNPNSLNGYMSLSMLNFARKSNYNEYVYNPSNIQIESPKIKEKYHQKIILLVENIKKGINSKYDYLPNELKNIPIHHVETDNDSNPNNNKKTRNAIQDLGEDIAGKHYFINLGEQFWDSHYLAPSINELQKVLMYLQSNDIDNLLEYNTIKEQKDESLFLRMNRGAQEAQQSLNAQLNLFYIPLFLNYTPAFPTISNELQEAIAYLESNPLSKESKPITLASSTSIRSDIGIEDIPLINALQQDKEQRKYNAYLDTYNAQISNYEKELQYFLKQNNIYQQKLYKEYQTYNIILADKIIPQLPRNFLQDTYSFYDLLQTLQTHNAYYTYVDSNDIENLSINDLQDESKLGYFYCLYYCNPLIVLDNKNKTTLNSRVITQNFGYKDDFYLSFLSNKDSITDEYLEARKSLYKSISQIKQERVEQELQELQKQQEILEQSLQNLDSKQKESQLKELQKEQEKALRDKQRQEQQQARLSKGNTQNLNNTNNNAYITKHSNLILESQDKSITIIFLDKLASKDLDKNISMSRLLHIHNNKIDIFTQDKTYLDIQSLLEDYQDYGITQDILNSSSTQIFFYSALLLGSSEIESNPFLFGELDKDNTIKQDTPSYYFSPKDEENNLGTLLIFLHSCTLTLLNYSLIDSSLNIKLELTNKESKEKQDKAIIQREQKQHKEQLKPLSIAMLHPILEDNEMKCSHGGVVQLKSNLGKSIQDKNIPFILETDLLYSSIVGCPNPPISGGPCTQVALILPSSRGLKKHNEDYPIMQDLVSSGVFSDKGVPLICTPKANSYKINAPNPTHTKNIEKEALKAQIEFHKPTLRLHYKEHKSQQDNLPITQFYLFDNLKEQESPFENLILDYQSDAQGISDKDLEKELLQSYPEQS